MGRQRKIDSHDPWEAAKHVATKKVRTTLSSADKKYCEPCVYKGRFNVEYLCDFLEITGHVRGCPPGVGCTQRRTEPIVKPERFNPVPTYAQHPGTKPSKDTITVKCQRCGVLFRGTPKTRYCSTCRILQLQEGHV